MQTIIDAISDKIAALYPDLYVYIDNIPEGFERPSFFVEFIQETSSPMNATTYLREISIQITYFGPLDNYYNVDVPTQYAVYEVIRTAFSGNTYIQVGDRAVKIAKFTGSNKNHEVFFEIDLETTDSNIPVDTSQLMGEININITNN